MLVAHVQCCVLHFLGCPLLIHLPSTMADLYRLDMAVLLALNRC